MGLEESFERGLIVARAEALFVEGIIDDDPEVLSGRAEEFILREAADVGEADMTDAVGAAPAFDHVVFAPLLRALDLKGRKEQVAEDLLLGARGVVLAGLFEDGGEVDAFEAEVDLRVALGADVELSDGA
ncbi:MAG: hypothetical protein U0359_09430 [Byssovorax sp.]